MGRVALFLKLSNSVINFDKHCKYSQSFDDEICCSNTVDPELVPEFDENWNFEMESQQEIIDVGGIIGRVESAFRENNGVPQVEGFIEQFISKIQLIFQSSNNITQNLNESQYIWVEYLTQNKSELNCWNLNSTDDNNEFEDPKCNFETSKRSLAKILKIEDSTIWISGALIMHNSSVVSILPINAIKNLLIKDIFFDPVLRKFNKINRAPVSNPKVVKYSEQVLKDFEEIVNQGKLDFYTSCNDIISTLNIILNMNPNWILTKTKTLAREIKAIAYDNLTIIYEDTDSCIEVLKVIWSTYFIETGSEHTKEWLDSLSNALNIEAILPIYN